MEPIKLNEVRNVQSTYVPETYPKKAIDWMIEFNSTKKPIKNNYATNKLTK